MTGRVLLFTLFLVSGVYGAVWAQGTLELRGTVTDEVGGPIAGADVTLTTQQPNVSQRQWTTKSDAHGRYVLGRLSPGHYLLSVTNRGFATTDRSLELTTGAAINGDAVLRVAIAEQVAVVYSLEAIRSVTGMQPTGLLLGPGELDLLPSDPDMMLQFLQDLAATSGRPDEVAVYVDGQPVAARLPPREAILSIRISTNAFAAEFAEPSSGLVEIVTKPAMKRYQSESQFTFNDSALNARNAFETDKRPTSTQAFSGYIGGPLIGGRWSVLAYGGRWQRNDRLIVNSTSVDPVELVAEPFVASVVVPEHTNSVSVHSDVALSSRHLLSIDLVGNRNSARNQGLETGLDLPERAISRDGRTDVLRVGLVSSFSPRLLGELRVRRERRRLVESATTDSPALVVLDAFSAGGNQARQHQDRATDEVSVASALTRTLDRHIIRVGARFDGSSYNEIRRTNQGGTWVFGSVVDDAGAIVATPLDRYIRTLQGLAGYGPSSFSIAPRDSQVVFRDWQGSWFVQDDWRRSANVTLSFGLRHDLQQQSRSRWTVAPRGGLAWRPVGDTRHVVRLAGGLFYSRIPPDVALDVLRYDGQQVREYIVEQPDFFPTIPSALETLRTSLPTVREGNRLDTPRTATVSTGYEWEIAKPLFAAISYTYGRGAHLLRTLNVNEPDPISGLRPRPDVGPLLQFASSGRSTRHVLSVTLRHTSTRVSLFGTYSLGSSRADSDGPYSVAADSTSLQGEFGRAADDQRHRGLAGGVVSLPGALSVSALVTASSGRPFNITTGRDDNGDLLFVDRPSVGVPGEAGAVETRFGTFDLSHPAGQPMIDRNTGRGPSQVVVNVGVSKRFSLWHSPAHDETVPYLIVTASAENITNRVNYVDYNGVVTSPLFGTANRASTARRIELAARVGF